LNYRHAFHAGSFADVFKHAILARILLYLREKPAGFRVIDTHAGAGLYDLTSPESERGGEWRGGIGALNAATLSPEAAKLLAPYLDVVASLNPGGSLRNYPGSPALACAMLRRQDRLIACELEPKAAAALRRNLRGDPGVKTVEIDGWMALSAYVPPIERRGVVLVDPAFEEEGDYARLASGLAEAHRKWAGGIYALWYPIKGRPEPDALAKRLRRLGISKLLRAELVVSPLKDPSRLNGCGLILANPPWTLEGELAVMLPVLAKVLGRDSKGSFRIDWLAGEQPAGR
jgi:23S rRNA (adenine2030-N6)-methyltransferase